MTYRLSIHKIEQSCIFELTWGKGQRLIANLPYPEQLTALYQAWRRAYLGHYKHNLRGKVGAVGQVVSNRVDWHAQVVQAEARLLTEFHRWLKDGELYDLRSELMQAHRDRSTALFLTCTPMELARLPWETWEFGHHLQIVRSPGNIRAATQDRRHFRRGRSRVLAILGDDTGLDFQEEQAALNAQAKLMEVHYVGWQPDEDLVALKQRICQAVADPLGWDVLFFAGHSNEAALVDGQVAIAPRTAISIKELSPYLQQAQRHGLQFALFNSCSGLDIANGLINLGLSQVAIMREPIHNEVAQTFLVELLQRLARFQNVQEALLGTCQHLKLEKQLTYPSAYLVPSLYRHPESVPYRIQPTGWRSWLRRWRPRRREVAAVGALAVISLMPPVQDWLMNQRVRLQAVYRNVTGQVVPSVVPPIVLVQIDDATLQARRIAEPLPIDRTLLADLVTQLDELGAQVVGIDYLLDRPMEEDALLHQRLRSALETSNRWFVFAAKRSHLGEWLRVYPDVATPNWSLEGDIWVPWWHIRPRGWSDTKPLPFSYQLAIAHHLAQGNDPQAPVPDLSSRTSLHTQIEGYWEETQTVPPISPRANLHPLTNFSYRLYQRWLQPLLDFSLPPAQVYVTVSAQELLQTPETVLNRLDLDTLAEQLVIVAAGGYDEAGDAAAGGDNWPLPPALAYWRDQAVGGLTGGEAHAYMAHHFLTGRLVVPIPDLWLVLGAALVGKALALWTSRQRMPRWRLMLTAGTVAYGVLALQLYISAAVLLPWLLPSLTLWFYLWPQEETR